MESCPDSKRDVYVTSNVTFTNRRNILFSLSAMTKETPLDMVLRWLKEADLTQADLARELRISSGAVSNWIQRNELPPRYYRRICDFLGKSMDSLGGRPSGKEENFRVSQVPVVGTAQLGTDGFWLETEHPVGHGDGYVALPSNDPNAYSVRVIGDSMHPRIRSGEFVVVEPNHQYSPGDEVLVVTRDGRSMVKEFLYRRDGHVALHSLNESHGRTTIPETDVEKIHYVAAIAKAGYFRPD